MQTIYSVNSKYSIEIDPRSHLEVFDTRHRYGKNLRLYFKQYMNTMGNANLPLPNESLIDKTKLFDEFFLWLERAEEVSNYISVA